MRPIPSFALLLALSGSVFSQDKVTYQDHVRPIFENRCMNCHNADKKKGGLDLSTYGATMTGGSGGVCLEPGDPAASKLLACVNFTAEPFMPPKSDKIPQAEIDTISKWIAGGLLDTASSAAKVKKKANIEMAVISPGQKPEGPPPMPADLLLDPVVVTPRPNSVTSVAHSPWAPLLAVAGERQVLLYHADNAELLGVLPFPEGNPEQVGFSRNASLVYAGGGRSGKNGIVVVWDVKTGKRITTVGEEFDSVLACDITPDHQRIALGGPGRKLKIYDTATGQCLFTIKKHTDWITSVAFSPDGILLASGDRNGGLYVWETGTGNEFYTLKGHEKCITDISWRPDANVLASSSEDGTVRWWEMMGGTQVKNFPAHGGAGVLSVHYGADGRLVTGGRDGKARIFAPDGNQTREWVPAEGALILRTRFAPDGQRVITAAWNGEVKAWHHEKDPKDAPPLPVVVNPPSIDTRIAELQKQAAEKQAAVDQAKAAAAEKEKMVAAAKADASGMEQQLAAMQAEMQKAAQLKELLTAAAAKLTEAKARFSAELEGAKAQVAALQKPAPPQPVASGMGEAVEASLLNATQAQAAAHEIALVLAETKVKDLTEVVAKHDSEIAQITSKLPPTDQNMAAITAQIAEMQKAMEPKRQAIDAADKVYQEAMGLVQNAANAVAEVQKSINRWLAAKENKTVILMRDESEALKDTVEGLKAEIPALEAEIKTLTEQKAANPPPAPEAMAEIDKKLATATKRLGEAKTELAAAEPQLAEKLKAAEAARAKYLEMLPK